MIQLCPLFHLLGRQHHHYLKLSSHSVQQGGESGRSHLSYAESASNPNCSKGRLNCALFSTVLCMMMTAAFLKYVKQYIGRPAISRTEFPSQATLLAAFTTTSNRISPQNPPPSAAPAAASQQEREKGTLSKILLFLPGAITFGLGTWQIIRRQEKIEMIEYRKKRLDMEPIMWSGLAFSGEDISKSEFRKVCCEGLFDETKNIYIGPRSRSISGVTENGYYVISPLIPVADDSDSLQVPILINRGWVPREWRNKALKNVQDKKDSLAPAVFHAEEKERSTWWKFWSKKPEPLKSPKSTDVPVKVVGVVRGSEKPSMFVPENDPSSGQWFYVDVAAIARACGLPANTIYIEDINENFNPSNPYPLPKDVNTLIRHSVMPQDHLNYTITWYTLSASVTYMASRRIRTSKGRR